jgi:hypothetical protein
MEFLGTQVPTLISSTNEERHARQEGGPLGKGVSSMQHAMEEAKSPPLVPPH